MKVFSDRNCPSQPLPPDIAVPCPAVGIYLPCPAQGRGKRRLGKLVSLNVLIQGFEVGQRHAMLLYYLKYRVDLEPKNQKRALYRA